MKYRLAAAGLLAAMAAHGAIVKDVRAALDGGDFARAEELIEAYKADHGETPELAAAVSWVGRGALKTKDYDRAEKAAQRARELALRLLEGRSLDEDRDLRIALGASIEVQARVMAARGELSEAVAFLNEEARRWQGTPIETRIRKNINLLTLEGKPAPPLALGEYVGPRPMPLEKLKGKVLLLFFWAHWCPDCKDQVPALARLKEEFGPKGLVVIAPTRRYGFVARGEEAGPEEELAYIEEIRRRHYAALGDAPAPVSKENFVRYGSSTTPTLVLIDREGVVRLYHPGNLSYEELAAKVKALL